MGESRVTFIIAENHRKGDTFKGFNFAVKTELGVADDLTDCVGVTAFFRKTGKAPDAEGKWNREGDKMIEMSIEDGKLAWINKATGTLKILPIDIDWPKGNYLADFEFHFSSGFKETLIDFLLPIDMDTTQPQYNPPTPIPVPTP